MSTNHVDPEDWAVLLARDKRLRAEFKGKIDTSCSLLMEHFLGLVKAAKVDSRSDAAAAGSAPEPGLVFSEQERLRRGEFQVTLHAESLSAAGDESSSA